MLSTYTTLRRADAWRRARRAALHVAVMATATACRDAVAPAPAALDATVPNAAVLPAARADGDVLPGQYIVLFADGVADPAGRANAKVATLGGSVTRTFSHAARGFAARLTAQAAESLRADPDVRLVEPDRVVRVADAAPAGDGGSLAALAAAPWNLDRLDQRDLPLDGTYSPANAGTGVTAYIVSSGIRFGHAELGGRATTGIDVIDGGAADDCNGFGTHAAALVGGATRGVARNVGLVAVRVTDCSGAGAISGVIAGIDWITANHASPAVAYLGTQSNLGSAALDDAVRRSIAAGVTYVYGAGTAYMYGSVGLDACAGSPSRVAEGITVGATDIADGMWISSNYGTCVDLLAPGVNVESAWWQGDAQTYVATGTLVSAAHAAGAAALYLAANPSASPAQVAAALVDNASPNRVSTGSGGLSNGTPNRLLYVGFLGGGAPPSNAPPSAAFTTSCAGLACTFTDASRDADGAVVAWSWNFGDFTSSTERSPTHAYAMSGTYTVILTVTDDRGAQSIRPINLVVGAQAPVIEVWVRGRREKGKAYADLTWSGASGASVDVWRNGAKLVTTANDGAHTDALGKAGTFSYKVCEVGTTVCSAPATVTF